jgi:hypothetical protein
VGQPPYAEPTCLTARNATSIPISRTCLLTGTKEDKCASGSNIRWSSYGYNVFYQYDPDDYAHDQADYMANNGIVAFVIGLGPLVTDASNCLNNDCTANPHRDSDSGERLLRYVADMGYDPDVKYGQKLWPCQSNWAWNSSVSKLPTGASLLKKNCGNYWYAATGGELKRVFEEIASRLFTRLAK